MNVKDLLDLTGKTAIVTGGTTGLGKQMAIGLAEMGADIIVASLDQSLCDQVADEFKAMNIRSLGIELDLANLESIQAMVNMVVDEFERIDILLNAAAAVGVTTPYDPITPEIWEQIIRVNLSGTFWCTHKVVDAMKKQRKGKIINICSVYAVVGVDPSLYNRTGEEHFEHFPLSSSKGGVLSMTRDMAVNFARWNINVNAISPGMFPSSAVVKKYGNEIFGKLREQTPLKRAGGEDDLKGAAVYLASNASNFVTGHNLVVDGGWLAW